MADYKYHRVLLKLSGEALMGQRDFGIDPAVPQRIAEAIKPAHDDGIQIAVVVGGGNIYRGVEGAAEGMDRAQGDNMGMLATVINSLALQDCFEKNGMDCRVMSAIEMHAISETYIRRRAEVLMKATKVDGIYNKDPKKYPEAKKFDTISYRDVLKWRLGVMDATATALCQENHMPIMVFNMEQEGAIVDALKGLPVGTTVVEED